jgi:hypothetical protein
MFVDLREKFCILNMSIWLPKQLAFNLSSPAAGADMTEDGERKWGPP